MDYDAFISYAHADGKDAAQSLKAALRGAYLDQHGNRAGGVWREQIQKAITQSSVFFFLITPGSVTSDFCQQEWAWAREAAKPIIPVLIKPVDKTKIAEKYHDFYDTVHAVQYIQPDEAPAWQRYHLHLRAVYREFDRAIHFATQAVTFIDIPTEQKDQYVQPEADSIFIRMVETPGKNETCSLEEAWAQYSERVLLLGDPGAGKTTMLLHHAQNLIAAYVRDPNQRMPFYTSIAQWDSYADQPLAEWFAEQYKLPPTITGYIEHGEAVLILDGLDELGSSSPIDPEKPEGDTYDPRQRFMAQVQRAVDDGNDVLITCRVKDYEAIGELFADMGAVQLRALSDDQIRTYLNNFPTVQTAVMDDADLLDICRSPLLLRLIAFGYRDAPADLQDMGSLKEGALRDAIFGQYITTSYSYEARRRADRGEEMPFTLEKMLEVLGHAAMINVSGGWRNDKQDTGLGSDITKNVLIQHDFTYYLKNGEFNSFCSLACDLHILYLRESETHGFLHLLLRDYLAYTYSMEHLYNKEFYSWIGPSPMKVIGGMDDPRAVDLLINTLADGDAEVRRIVATALGRLRDVRAVEPLIDALADVDSGVCRTAAESLGMLEDARAVNPLINALTDEDAGVCWSAAEALARLGETALYPLLDALRHKKVTVRRSVVNVLGRLNNPGVVEHLINTLSDSSPSVRRSVAEALGQLRDARAVVPLIATLSDTDSGVRRSVAMALGQLDDPQAVPALIERLEDTVGKKSSRVCDVAAVALMQIGTPEARIAVKEWRWKCQRQGWWWRTFD